MLFSSKRKQPNTNGYYGAGQIESILSLCSIKIGGEIDSHFLLFCPFHYNVHTPACEIDKSNGMFICFSCGETGNIIDMVMKVTNRTYFEAVRLINSYQDAVNIEDQVDHLMNETLELPEFDMNLIHRLNTDLLTTERGKEYFKSRKINIDAMRDLLLGYSEKQDMVTVPIFSVDNRCVGFVGRSIEGKSFKNSTGLPKSKVLFNLNRYRRDRVAVVESSFDAIRLWQLNIPAVATLGASISKSQVSLLQSYTSGIIICPDNDDAGKQLEDKVIRNVNNKQIDVIRLNKGKDIGDLEDEEIINIFNSYSNKLILAV